MPRPVLLIRPSLWNPEEDNAARVAGWPVIDSVLDITPGGLVVPRYSALPFYEDLERDIQRVGARIINSWRQHRYVADLENWTGDLADVTPMTWYRPSDVPLDCSGPFVLKGRTNSRKGQWKTHMYAADREQMLAIAARLQDDSLIGHQGVVVREFVELERLGEQVNGQPITTEHRIFVLGTRILVRGFYWSSVLEDLVDADVRIPDPADIPAEFLESIIQRTAGGCPFRVIDVGRLSSGDWTVIELNDGQMSAPSACDLNELYRNLLDELTPT